MRVKGTTDIYNLKVTYDINKDLLKIDKENSYYFSIKYDKTKKLNMYDPKEDTTEGIYKEWDYVTHGTVFEIRNLENDRLHVGISFGGLLMGLEGKKIHLKKILNDTKVFCFLRVHN